MLPGKVSGLLFDSYFNESCTDFVFDMISETTKEDEQNQECRQETHQGHWHHQEIVIHHFAESWIAKGRQESLDDGRKVRAFIQCQRKAARKIKEVVDWSKVLCFYPSTYPDELLTIAQPFAVRYLLWTVLRNHLHACRFRSTVFMGPDVFIPPHLAIHISAGLKYTLYKLPKPSLIKDAYAIFEQHFKWSYHFETSGEGQSFPYDPDYNLHKESDTVRPMPPPFIENGLRKGQEYVDHFVTSYSLSTAARHCDSCAVWLAEIKSYLDEHDYVITPTDKNLGAAVVKQEWINDSAHILLSDTKDY
jgi:hypothetical protein